MEYQDGEMTDALLKTRFSELISEAAHAFSIDSSYAESIVLKAKTIKARKSKRSTQ